MKTFIRVFIGIIYLSFLINYSFSQININAGEYFINIDPGEGNGIPFFPKDGNFNSFLEEFQINISTSLLNEGVNTLFIRLKDNNGNWGKALAKSFVVRDTSAFYVNLPPKLTDAEYFVDTDPGEGNGTGLNTMDGNYDGVYESVIGSLNTSALSEGIHTLYVRMKNENGTWGKALAKSFVVRDTSAFYVNLPPKLTNAEYFVDNDPGEGNGVSLNAVDGNYDGVYESVIGSLNTSALSEGIHTLYVRMKNENGTWGRALAKSFVVRDASAFYVNLPPKLTDAEYFVDTDPGEGNGISLNAVDGNYDGVYESVIEGLNTSALSEGIHTLYIRMKNENGTWGKALAKSFIVRDSSAFVVNMPSKIKNVKYYIDNNSEAFEVRAKDGVFDQYYEQILDTIYTSALLEDVHSIAVRFESESGLLSQPFYTILEIKNVTPPLQPVGLIAIPRNHKVILSWNKNPDHDIYYYVVYRNLESGFEPTFSDSIASVISPDTTYIDKDVSNGIEYFYKIKAVDVALLNSVPSEQVSVIPVNTAPLSFSLLLPADGDTLSTVGEPVLFTWRKSSDIDDDSLIYRLRILGPDLDTTVVNILDTTLNFNGQNLFKSSITYEWKVEVTDGLEWISCEKGYKFTTPYFVRVLENEDKIPEEFVLLQNYPNPFNPVTTIHYEIPKESFVTLKVYNLLGQEVATLVDETKQTGKYEVKFDGSTLSNGVYFYRLKTNDFVATKILILIK